MDEQAVDVCLAVMAELWENRNNGNLVFNQRKTLFLIVDKGIVVHYDIIKIRCPKLLEHIKKQDYTYYATFNEENNIIEHILHYCYVSNVKFEQLTMEQILKIESLSNTLELPHLQYISEKYLLETYLKFEESNAFHLMHQAIQHRNWRMKDLITQYFLANYDRFIANKDGIMILGIEEFPATVAAFQARPTAPNIVEVPDTLPEDYLKIDCIKCNKIKSARK